MCIVFMLLVLFVGCKITKVWMVNEKKERIFL